VKALGLALLITLVAAACAQEHAAKPPPTLAKPPPPSAKRPYSTGAGLLPPPPFVQDALLHGYFCFDLPGAARLELRLIDTGLAWIELAEAGTASAWHPVTLDLATGATAVDLGVSATPPDLAQEATAAAIVLAYDVTASFVRHDTDASGGLAASDEADVCLIAPALRPVAVPTRRMPKWLAGHESDVWASLTRTLATPAGVQFGAIRYSGGRLRIRLLGALSYEDLARRVAFAASALAPWHVDLRIDIDDGGPVDARQAAVTTWLPDGRIERRVRLFDCVQVDLPEPTTTQAWVELPGPAWTAAQDVEDWRNNMKSPLAGLGVAVDLAEPVTDDSLGPGLCEHEVHRFTIRTDPSAMPADYRGDSTAKVIWQAVADLHATQYHGPLGTIWFRNPDTGRRWSYDGKKLREVRR
jgi:hypothetical protein